MYVVLGGYQDGNIISDVTLNYFANINDAIACGRKFEQDYLYITIRYMNSSDDDDGIDYDLNDLESEE